jgi:biotin operon repressor
MTKKEQIIKLYQKKKLVHPSLGEIAKEVGVFKSYVWKCIKQYKNEKNSIKR